MRRHPFNAVPFAVVAAWIVVAPGATSSPRAESTVAATERMANPADTGIAPWGPAQIVVYKSKRSLALYREGVFLKEFRVNLGLQPSGPKRHADDARTPEGSYRVVAKRRHPRWQHFLALDYPNTTDRRNYGQALRDGRIPGDGHVPFAIGDSIGIHGNDRPAEQERGVDWTKGCIAMRSADIEELAQSVPVGTPVWIVE